MPGAFGSPYRAPCGGWPATARRWGGISHLRTADKAIIRWENITKFKDYTDLESYIAPYTIPTEACDTGSCVPVACGGTNEPPCYPFDRPIWLKMCSAGAGETVSEIADNCYRRTETTIDFSECRKIGFKNAQAEKVWHGAKPLNICPCAPLTVKYLTARIRVLANYTCTAAESNTEPEFFQQNNFDARYDATYTVDKQSGVRTKVDCVRSMTCLPDLNPGCEARNNNYLLYLGNLRFHCDQWDGAPAPTGFEDPDVSGPKIIAYGIQRWLNDVLTNSRALPWDTGEGFIVTIADYAATAVHWQVTFEYSSEQGVCIETFEGWFDLSDPYTLQDVLDELKILAAEFPLDDDVLYPWRTDEFCSVAPIVARKEWPTPKSPDRGGTECEELTGEYPEIYTGEIIGSPLPKGYAGFWDIDHATQQVCGAEGFVNLCTSSRGAMSGSAAETGDATDAAMPATATKWTEQGFAGYLRGGAWVEYGPLDTNSHPIFDKIRLQKWAVILLPWPSTNFARPCGIDRRELDSGSSECIVTSAGYPPTLELEGDIAVTGTEWFAIQSGTYSLAGIYECTRPDVAQLNVGTKLFDIPSWMEYSQSEKATKLRWSSARPFCQPLNVLAAVDNTDGTVSVTVSGEAYLLGRYVGDSAAPATPGHGELLDFTGVGGLGTDVEVISASSLTTFMVAGSLSGAYTGGGTVATDGYDAALTKWNDDNPKRDFIKREWSAAGTLTETALCLFPVQCAPSVMCWSPNDETFAHGNTYEIPLVATNFVVNECDPTVWQGDFLQADGDPFWKAPPAPCTGGWRSDNGSCLADDETYTYYPHGPWTEPLLTAPAGSPSLPVPLHGTPGQPGQVGHSGSNPRPCDTPWGFWLRLKAATAEAATCRFKAEYKRWFRGCA